jgi:hypothetical protein
MKLTNTQLSKLNMKLKFKYSECNLVFEYLPTYKMLQIKYTELDSRITSEDKYLFGYFNSVVNTAKTFDDIYYSI